MKKVIVFGNCQASQLQRILSTLLPASEFQVSYFSNNTRTGGKKSNQVILTAIKDCDLLIYQPLSQAHGELSEENLKKVTKPDCVKISFPYCFNSGVYSLCHAPLATTHPYGVIYGEEIIISQLKSGKSKQEIIQDYKNNRIDFDLIMRFNQSLAEMKRRETSIDIKMTDFIEKNYLKQKLFITHNHPANIYFYEIIRQITNIVSLPITSNNIHTLNFPELRNTNSPIAPYDIEAHGYEFDADQNWVAKGTSLINLIIDNYLINQTQVSGWFYSLYKRLMRLWIYIVTRIRYHLKF